MIEISVDSCSGLTWVFGMYIECSS